MLRLLTSLVIASLWLCIVGKTIVRRADIHNKVIHKVDDRFLSVALDSALVRDGWRGLNTSSVKLRTLARALSPSLLRFGGNDADFLIFDPEKRPPLSAGLQDVDVLVNDNFTMTRSDFDMLNKFAASAGWHLLFDFNALLRNGSDWDATNAKAILRYAVQQGYASNMHLELGNEMNHISIHWGQPLPAPQYAEDFMSLRELIHTDPEFKTAFRKSHLVAPDVTRPVDKSAICCGRETLREDSLNYLKEYLDALHGDLTAVTWHQYYVNGRNTTLEDFTRPSILNLFPQQVAMVKSVVMTTEYAHTPIWLGETSSAYGGGAPGLSNTYVAGFLWLDKLGIAARDGISLVIRQSFYWNHYALLDEYTMDPRPDYWLSLLYKNLVGGEVLNVTVSENKSTRLRVYAHCTNTERSEHPAGSVTVYALNLHDDAVNLTIKGVNTDHGFAQYLLTPHTSVLQSTLVDLNGKSLYMVDDTTLPKMLPQYLPKNLPLHLPPKTFGFFVVLQASPELC